MRREAATLFAMVLASPAAADDWAQPVVDLQQSLAALGVNLNGGITGFGQGLAAGDGEHGVPFGGKADVLLGLDGDKLGLWTGLSVSAHFEQDFGQSANELGAGAILPVNTALAFPTLGGTATDLSTKVIDLAGRMLMPGFVGSHIHPFVGAFMTSGVDLQLPTRADALAAIASYAKAHTTGPIRGFGWRVDMFPPEGPTRDMLDSAIPDRPAFFFAIDGHSLWVNSKALEIARIDARTPDPIPDFSFFVRDKTGKPTGYVLETSAILEVVNAVEPISL